MTYFRLVPTPYLMGALILVASAAEIKADTKIDGKTVAKICKAGIAAMMFKSPKIIKVDSVKAGVAHLWYIREDDQTKWSYRCKLEGDRIIWASANPDSTGRWRDHPLDEKIFYKNSKKEVTIMQKYSDGSSTEETYSTSSL